MEYFIGAYKKYADFSGRARRKEYWMFTLFFAIIYIALIVLTFLLPILGLLIAALYLGSLIPIIALTTRRLHDIGRSGWWQLLHLTGVGSIVIFVFTLLDSVEDNEFGANPKA